jgi:hypothetical protein
MPRGIPNKRNTNGTRKLGKQFRDRIDRRRSNSESGELGDPMMWNDSIRAATAGVNTREVVEHLTKQRNRIDRTIEHLEELPPPRATRKQKK